MLFCPSGPFDVYIPLLVLVVLNVWIRLFGTMVRRLLCLERVELVALWVINTQPYLTAAQRATCSSLDLRGFCSEQGFVDVN